MVTNAVGEHSSVHLLVPVQKGDSVKFDYPSLYSKALRFMYAQGQSSIIRY